MVWSRFRFIIVILVVVLVVFSGCTQQDRERTQVRDNQRTGIVSVTSAGTLVPAANVGTTSNVQTAGTAYLPDAAFNAGYQVHEFTYTDGTGKAKPLTVAIWYPTVDVAAAFSYGRSDLKGEVSVKGKSSGNGLFPLVIFSHGYGGCGLQSVFFTEELARQGYVVAAPDHNDALSCSIQQGDRGSSGAGFDLRQFGNPGDFTDTKYVDRRDDVKAVIDEMLRLNTDPGSDFFGTIDPGRIGMSGHSLGGYTTMGVVGGWGSWLDMRIRAALMFSPYVEPYLINSDIGKIHVPLMYQGGTTDLLITPALKRAGGVYDSSNPPKYFLEIQKASHMAWSNTVCKRYGTVSECLTTDDKARVIDAYGIAFFDRYLKSRQRPVALTQKDPVLSEYRYQE